MSRRSRFSVLALVPFAIFAACSDSDNTGVNAGVNASVGFINATGSPITVANNGAIGVGNNALAFGANSSCMQVNANVPAVAFTNANTNAAFTNFSPAFTPGGHFTVVAFTDANGNTQFATLNNAFTPAAGNAGLLVFNAAGTATPVVALGNGTALGSGTAVAAGTGGTFFNVPAGTQDITFNTGTGTATLVDLGNMSFTAGQNSVLVLGPAASGSTTLRGVLVPVC